MSLNKINRLRIYDGAFFCDPCCDKCPVVELNRETNMVEIYDPAKPENGKTQMTIEEYNALIENAKKIEITINTATENTEAAEISEKAE